jgi:DTW domain-containing protein YfiP
LLYTLFNLGDKEVVSVFITRCTSCMKRRTSCFCGLVACLNGRHHCGTAWQADDQAGSTYLNAGHLLGRTMILAFSVHASHIAMRRTQEPQYAPYIKLFYIRLL